MNKKKKIVLLVSISGILFVGIMAVLFSSNFGMNGLMGNSVTKTIYYCEDSTYTLKDNKCTKLDSEKPHILGDINEDGIVTEEDLNKLLAYLNKKEELKETTLSIADVNKDGVVSIGDSENIRLYLKGVLVSDDKLNKIGESYVCSKGYTLKDNLCVFESVVDAKEGNYLLGDINIDGNKNNIDVEILSNYLNRRETLDSVKLVLSDYNEDGVIDKTDLDLLVKDIGEENNIAKQLGDVNRDSVVDYNDILILEKYVNKQIDLDRESLLLADINKDGKVDKLDLDKLVELVYTYYKIGDVNLDGFVDTKDLSLMQNAVNGVSKLNLLQIKLADYNKDNQFDKKDVAALRAVLNDTKEYKTGDVNMDGKISSSDVSIIEKFIKNKTELTFDQLELADYNKDGKVDKNDVNALIKKVALDYPLGDVNMDKHVNFIDAKIIKDYTYGLKKLNSVQKYLGDRNRDGKVDLKDLK